MIATAIRRFSVAAPRFNPPTATASVPKTASSMSPSSSRRVAMMPSYKQDAPLIDGSAPSSQSTQAQQASSFEDVLTVGGISSHCDGQKISRASEGSI